MYKKKCDFHQCMLLPSAALTLWPGGMWGASAISAGCRTSTSTTLISRMSSATEGPAGDIAAIVPTKPTKLIERGCAWRLVLDQFRFWANYRKLPEVVLSYKNMVLGTFVLFFFFFGLFFFFSPRESNRGLRGEGPSSSPPRQSQLPMTGKSCKIVPEVVLFRAGSGKRLFMGKTTFYASLQQVELLRRRPGGC